MQSSSLKTAAARALITPVSLIMSVLCIVDTNARWPFFCGQQKCHRRPASSLWLMPGRFSLFCLMDRGDSVNFFLSALITAAMLLKVTAGGRVSLSSLFSCHRSSIWRDSGAKRGKSSCKPERWKKLVSANSWKYADEDCRCHRKLSSPLHFQSLDVWVSLVQYCWWPHGGSQALKMLHNLDETCGN